MKHLSCLLLFVAVHANGAVAVGMKETELLATQGKPSGKLLAASRVIYRWPDMVVTVSGGVVSKVELRDAAAEANEAEQRQQLVAAITAPSQPTMAAPGTRKIYARSFLGKKAPHLSVETWISNQPPAWRGKFLLVDFWATWCGPCRRSIPELNEVHRRFGNRVVVVGISDEPPATIRKMKEPRIEYFVATDTKADMKRAVQVTGIPHAMLIDPAGIVRWEGMPLGINTPEMVAAVLASHDRASR